MRVFQQATVANRRNAAPNTESSIHLVLVDRNGGDNLSKEWPSLTKLPALKSALNSADEWELCEDALPIALDKDAPITHVDSPTWKDVLTKTPERFKANEEKRPEKSAFNQ